MCICCVQSPVQTLPWQTTDIRLVVFWLCLTSVITFHVLNHY